MNQNLLASMQSAGLLVILTIPALLSAADQWSGPEHQRKPPQYSITDLGTFGGPFSMAYGLNQKGDVGGTASLPDGSSHAFLWTRSGGMQDLGTFAGPNSGAGAPNDRDVVPLIFDSSETDPYDENSCLFGTPLLCAAGIWKDGLIIPYEPLVKGHNAQTTTINNRGQVVGFADNDTADPDCSAANPSQHFDFEAVLWDRNGAIHELQPLPGDTVGFAIGLNDHGEAVGSSGLCGNTPLLPLAIGPHAVMWQRDGSLIRIPGLGGSKNNTATSINNRGEVIGVSTLPGDVAVHTFLWTRTNGTRDLGTVDSDLSSLPAAMHALNNKTQLVGASCVDRDAIGDLVTGLCRAYLWEDGVMMDLNALVPAGSNPAQLKLLLGFGINDSAQIAGWGLTATGEIHAFLATPLRTHHDKDER